MLCFKFRAVVHSAVLTYCEVASFALLNADAILFGPTTDSSHALRLYSMSQADVPHEVIDLEDRVEGGGNRAENQALEGSNFVDGSGPLFTVYTEMAEEYDKKQAERWQADADGILIFTGLFSAAVATLVSVSIQDLRPSSQDTTAFYVASIYQLLAEANGTQVSIPSTLRNPASPFSPPAYAIWVNSLWFLSLAISLTCALLATLLQQWVRRYIKITQPRSSPHTRGRIRAFFF